MDLQKEIQHLSSLQGITYLGFGELPKAGEAGNSNRTAERERYLNVISLGISLPDAVVDQLPSRFDAGNAINYKHHAYDIINLRLDLAASLIAGHLQQNGYSALPIPASKQIDQEKMYGAFSHKMAAGLSGLGWIGKSTLLITPAHGPRVRWASILTEAPLASPVSPLKSKCGECTACRDICPSKAIKGTRFEADKPRENQLDVHACEGYLEKMKTALGVDVCGMCLYICPFGKK